MEEGGRDKTPVQSQQPSATTPSGADEKSSGKERRDAGEKDKEQELTFTLFTCPGVSGRRM
uniref:Proteasome (prosome, macropain) 26S subunit, non-ATPase, 2 n=1 Tax=Mus musculus TaxID=10090 RepID=E9Q2S8_MOUSE